MSTPKLCGPAYSIFVRGVRLYAAELGIQLDTGLAPYGEKIEFRSPEHLALNPFGKVPILLAGEFTLFESAAICDWLDAEAGSKGLLGKLMQNQQAVVGQWAAAVGIYGRQWVMDGFLLELAFPKGENGQPRMNIVMENIADARRFVAIMEQQLANNLWLAGSDYSMADSLLTPFLDYLEKVPPLDADGPMIAPDSACARFVEAVRARESAWVLSER